MVDDASLIRSSSLMALGTIFSRITGFIRNLFIVAVLGTGLLGDAYNVGNTTPNIIYNLLIGGSLTAVFVPQIVRAFRHDDGGKAFISRLVTALFTLLFTVTALAMLAAPLLVDLYAPTLDSRSRSLTLAFTLYCLPQIAFYGLFGILGQITNAKEKFGPMMWAPIANNLFVIGIFGYFLTLSNDISLGTITDSQVRILGIGTTAGIAIQSLILIPFIVKSGISIRPRFDWRGSGLGTSLRLGGWTFLSVLISQLGFLITVNLATRAGVTSVESGITYGAGYTPYANAYLILLLPHSIIAISLVTAILPQLSSLVIDAKKELLREKVISVTRIMGVVTVPAAFFFLFFGTFIAESIFPEIDLQSARYVGQVLSAFSLAAIPLSLNLIGIRVLNAFENTQLQALSNAIINAVAVLLSLVAYELLPPERVVVGLAGAFTLSYWVGFVVTDLLLSRFIGSTLLIRTIPFYVKLTLLASVSVLLVYFTTFFLSINGNFITLVIVLLATSLIYLLLARVFQVREVGEMMKSILRR